MAEAGSGSPQLSLHKVEGGLARARLLWALKPMGLLLLVLWVFHPATVDRIDVARVSLLGFLLGAGYGLIVFSRKLQEYTSINQLNDRDKPNRVPQEYYWGNISQTLYDNR
jgi:hypothetical protein